MQQIHDTGFVLHKKPFTNTSALLICITKEHGLITLIAKGVKKQSKANFNLEPFVLQEFYFAKKNDFGFLNKQNIIASFPELNIKKLYTGLYANELLMHILKTHESEPCYYSCYKELLYNLCTNNLDEYNLRVYELKLLKYSGFGVESTVDSNGHEIHLHKNYSYSPESGFIYDANGLFSGQLIKNIANGNFKDQAHLVKKITISAIASIVPNIATKQISKSYFKYI